MSEFLHLDSAKLFMWMNPANPGDSERSSLSDEIEKAHRLIWDLFLQMLDAARIHSAIIV